MDSISIEVTHKIPISPKKIAIPNESDEIIRGQIAHLQPKKEHMNSVEISQPKVSTIYFRSNRKSADTLPVFSYLCMYLVDVLFNRIYFC